MLWQLHAIGEKEIQEPSESEGSLDLSSLNQHRGAPEEPTDPLIDTSQAWWTHGGSTPAYYLIVWATSANERLSQMLIQYCCWRYLVTGISVDVRSAYYEQATITYVNHFIRWSLNLYSEHHVVQCSMPETKNRVYKALADAGQFVRELISVSLAYPLIQYSPPVKR